MVEQNRLGPESSRAYFSLDTIVAISSAVGGAIAVVRISGPDALPIARGLCPTIANKPEPRQTTRGKIRNPKTGLLIDDALWTYFAGPRSYTGEDTIEWMIHGSARIASALVESALALGARQALPGEFSFRAVRNGKLTLEQAHAVADLISAKNDGAIALALDQLSGTQSHWVQELAEDLRKLATLSELGIDFSDQNVEEVALPTLKKQAAQILSRLSRLASTLARGTRLKDGVAVTLIGAPNAGKSSLFNALLGEDRSIVSEVPGTTRDIVRESLTLGQGGNQTTFKFADTAGLRRTDDLVEMEGVRRTLGSATSADILVAVVDGSTQDWKTTAETLVNHVRTPSLVVFTKLDQIHPSETPLRQKAAQVAWPTVPQVWLSSVDHAGIDSLIIQLIEAAKPWIARDSGELLLTRLDQQEAILNCAHDLERAMLAPTEDLFAADVRQGLLKLAPLIGDTLPDDILGKIFSDFCIGK